MYQINKSKLIKSALWKSQTKDYKKDARRILLENILAVLISYFHQLQ